jgi:hypothetical protein
MKKTLSILIAFAMLFSMFTPLGMTKVDAAANNNDSYKYELDIDPYLNAQENDPVKRAEMDARIIEAAAGINFNEELDTSAYNNDENFTFNGGTKEFLGYDTINGYYWKTYSLRSIGEQVEVWVANDLSFPDGDNRVHVVTQQQVDQLRDEFDSNIYQKDTDFFGMPDSHDGSHATLAPTSNPNYYVSEDGVERVIMLIDNCRDENYYDSTYPFYVAGFYSSTYERYFDRNIINIDSNKWDVRIPDNGIFGTIAHEFQHLIHRDNDASEETWINEGMSDFAEYLCGYESYWGHVNFFLAHPENSLVEWDEHYNAETGPEVLADYGQAFLMQLYLKDKYGKDFVKALAQDPDHGIDSTNKILAQFDTGIDFEELFRRFSIAVAIDSKEPGNSIYNFESIDLNVNYESALTFDKDGVPAWGADYKEINDANKIQNITIDGIDFLPNPWVTIEKDGRTALWGNAGDEKANQLIFKADLTNVVNPTLDFDHYYDIESEWDYGVVQVSTDNGTTWVSLSNENTTTDVDPDGYPAIKDNVPGFTGTNDEWTTETFDLSAYKGKEILINFNYMTDWGSNGEGWFIDNLAISEIDYSNDCTSLDGFMSIDEINKNFVEYALVFINQKSLGKGKNQSSYRVLNIDPMNISEADAIQLKEFLSGGNNYMIVWYAAETGTKGTVDFTYEITPKNDFAKQNKVDK